MDYHLERKLRLLTDPEYKSLYSWAINEIDETGAIVGRDQIPWTYTLYFTATSCTLSDQLDIEREWSPWKRDETEETRISKKQNIRISLRPGRPADSEDDIRSTTYSMFGTKREIQDFQLQVFALDDPSKDEHCRAMGLPIYTSEIDFRDDTQSDFLYFSLYVKPEMFERYVSQIQDGAIDDIVFSIGHVSGFYSDWSPSISTNHVKVLCQGKEQEIQGVEEDGISPPRLGPVGDANLHIVRRLVFSRPGSAAVLTSHESLNLANSNTNARLGDSALISNSHTQQALLSLIRSANWITVVLTLILIAILFKI